MYSRPTLRLSEVVLEGPLESGTPDPPPPPTRFLQKGTQKTSDLCLSPQILKHSYGTPWRQFFLLAGCRGRAVGIKIEIWQNEKQSLNIEKPSILFVPQIFRPSYVPTWRLVSLLAVTVAILQARWNT
jgi:hypothetical protein